MRHAEIRIYREYKLHTIVVFKKPPRVFYGFEGKHMILKLIYDVSRKRRGRAKCLRDYEGSCNLYGLEGRSCCILIFGEVKNIGADIEDINEKKLDAAPVVFVDSTDLKNKKHQRNIEKTPPGVTAELNFPGWKLYAIQGIWIANVFSRKSGSRISRRKRP